MSVQAIPQEVKVNCLAQVHNFPLYCSAYYTPKGTQKVIVTTKSARSSTAWLVPLIKKHCTLLQEPKEMEMFYNAHCSFNKRRLSSTPDLRKPPKNACNKTITKCSWWNRRVTKAEVAIIFFERHTLPSDMTDTANRRTRCAKETKISVLYRLLH